jgi:hypothetical protein
MEKMTPKEPIGILPVICLLLPFLLFAPYHWFVFDSAASGDIVSLRLDEDHRRTHLGIFWTLTYGLFTIISLFTALVLFIRRARRNRATRTQQEEV